MSSQFRNHALRSYPRTQAAPVIPASKDASILDWLEQSGRLLDAPIEAPYDEATPEELSDFINDDSTYNDFDDDDDDALELED